MKKQLNCFVINSMFFDELKNFEERINNDAVDALGFALQHLTVKLTVWEKIRQWFRKLFCFKRV